MQLLWVWKTIIWLIPIGLLVWLFTINIALDGVTFERAFGKGESSAFITDFTPGDRVQDLRVLIKDPVYVHVRSPRAFSKMELTLYGTYLNRLQIGLQTGPTREQFALHKPYDVLGGIASFSIPLASGFRDAEGRYTLIFSFKDKEAQPVIDRMKIEFK